MDTGARATVRPVYRGLVALAMQYASVTSVQRPNTHHQLAPKTSHVSQVGATGILPVLTDRPRGILSDAHFTNKPEVDLTSKEDSPRIVGQQFPPMAAGESQFVEIAKLIVVLDPLSVRLPLGHR